jgi:hypothetical protein
MNKICPIITLAGKELNTNVHNYIYITRSLTLREQHRLRVFEKKRLLRRIFRPKRDEVTAEWRKLHNEELHDLYSSPSIIRVIKARKMRWARHVERIGGEEKRV